MLETQIPATHNYTQRSWGHDYTFDPRDGGMTAEMTGWGYGLREGDYLIIAHGDDTTRYQIVTLRYSASVHDMWFAHVKFAPRTKAEKGEK